MQQKNHEKKIFRGVAKKLIKTGVELRQYYHSFLTLFPPPYSFSSCFNLSCLKNQIKDIDGIYIHIPFCKHFCKYCYYYKEKFEGQSQLERYLNLLKKEIELFCNHFNFYKKPKIKALYIGGGTPSLLNEKQFQKLFSILNNHFYVKTKTEKVVEANPASVTEKKIKYLKRIGVNRMSLGIQSFDQKLLKKMGRRYTIAYLEKSINIIKKYFNDWNIDIIFGFPGQTSEILKEDLEKLKEINPPSITFYQLSLKRNICIFRDLPEYSKLPKNVFPSLKEAISMKYLLSQFLKHSNYKLEMFPWFLKPDFSHPYQEMTYKSENIIGFGPSARSTGRNWGYSNVPTLQIYKEKLKNNTLPICSGVILTPVEIELRKLLLELKMGEVSVNLDLLRHPITENVLDKLEKLKNTGVILKKGKNVFQLSDIGKMFADEITSYLVPKLYHSKYCEHVCVHTNTVWSQGRWGKYEYV